MSRDLAVVTSYFNLCGFKKKLENYKIFREGILKTGVHLLTMEVVFGEGKSDLIGYPDVITFYAKDVMWLKERLLDEGIKHLLRTTEFSKIMWIDADAVFENNNWVENTERALDKYEVVQCFNHAWSLYSDTKQERCSAIDCTKKGIPLTKGAPGGALAATRSFLEKCDIHQHAITGGGDTLFTLAVCKELPIELEKVYNMIDSEVGYIIKWAFPMLTHWLNWAYEVQLHIKPEQVSFVEQSITFLEHGKQKNRRGPIRTTEMLHFNPYKDIRFNPKTRVFDWSSDKFEFHKAVEDYFWQRNDDDI